jgi:hypothetical protein
LLREELERLTSLATGELAGQGYLPAIDERCGCGRDAGRGRLRDRDRASEILSLPGRIREVELAVLAKVQLALFAA